MDTSDRFLRVECYVGQEPRRFYLGARKVEVRQIVDRWLATEHRYFKLRGDDGDIYILRHEVPADAWDLTMFSRRGGQ